jgi:hypothetical protein
MEIVQELEEVRRTAKDYLASSNKLAMAPNAKALVLPTGEYGLTRVAETQLAEKVKVPLPFYDRLRDNHPDILADMVNKLFLREPAQHLVRTLPGKCRAVLGTGYRTGLDNYGLAEAVLPTLKEVGAVIASTEITDTRFYVKALLPHLTRELPMPEGLKMGEGHNFFVRKVEGGLTISNSEVGLGSIQLLPGVLEEQCTNFASYRSEGLVKVHLGKKTTVDDAVAEYISDTTRALDDAAFWSMARDHVKALCDGRVFTKLCDRMVAARAKKIEGNPEKLVEVFAERNQFTEVEKGGLLRHLVESQELTQYGLQWAVTRLSQDAKDYDRATELERLGGQVIELPKQDWQVLAQAA